MKSKLTLEIEQKLIKKYEGTSFRYATEVSIHDGRGNYGIADFVAVQYNHEWGMPDVVVYEIKVSIDDFKSQNGHNLYGDENYYVMPVEVWEQIMLKDPRLLGQDVGVYVYSPASKRLTLKRTQSPHYLRHQKRLRIEERFYLMDQLLMRCLKGTMSKTTIEGEQDESSEEVS